MPTVRTSLLEIAYRDDGPRDAPVVLLLHGWPDDASTWDGIIPVLNAAGLRTIAPTTRGFGATRFLSPETPRTGNTARLALDAIAMLDALGIERFSIAGHDWGANMAEMLAVGWPERVQRIALLSTPPRLGGMATPPFRHARRQWYHWFQATERGARAVRDDRKGFARIMWETWSPAGWFDDATFERVAKSFDNPDWAEVTLHSYRSRWDEADPDPSSTWLDDEVKATKTLALPTLYSRARRTASIRRRRARQSPRNSPAPSRESSCPASAISRRARRQRRSRRGRRSISVRRTYDDGFSHLLMTMRGATAKPRCS